MDPNHKPIGESDTNDNLADNELSDDEEYIEARQNRAKFRRYVLVDEVVDKIGTSTELQKTVSSNESIRDDDNEE